VVHQHNTQAPLVIASQITTSAGNTGLTKTGEGMLILAPTTANTYAGATRVNGGVLRLAGTASAIPGGIGATGGTANIDLRGGVLGLENGDFSRGVGTGATQIQISSHGGFAAYGVDRTVNFGGANGLIYWNDGTGSVAGGMIRTGFNFILGATDSDARIIVSNPLELRGNIAESNFYTPSPLADRTFDVRNGSSAIDGELSGVLSGLGARLSKIGTGTLLLSGANTYTSDTRVGQGTLLISNTNESGRARVQSGATFGGTGSLKGCIDAEAGSTVAPGVNGVGTLTAGGLTMSGNAKLRIDVNTSTDTADQFIVTTTTLGHGGMASLGSGALLEFSFIGSFTGPYNESFVILRNDTGTAVSGLLNGVAQNGTVNNGSVVYSINYAFLAPGSDGLANDVQVTFSSVPEPSAAGLLAIGVAGLLRRRRRHG
jgi:autotransporter-associated beta strand protein